MIRFRSDTAVALLVIAAQIVAFVFVMCALAFVAAAVLTFAGLPR